LFLSTWWMLAGAVAGWLGRRGHTAAPVLASLWVLVEAGRGRVPFGGFPWGDVGYAFHDWGAARALAGWGGVPLVSWLAVAVNGWVLDAALAWRAGRRPERRPEFRRAFVGPLGGIMAALLATGAATAARPGLLPAGRLRVALVQGNDRNRNLTLEEIRDRYLVRNHLRLAGAITVPVDLIVLPESSLDADPRQDRSLDVALTSLAAAHHADVLAGGNIPAPQGRLYNAAFHYRPEPADPTDPPATGRTPEIYRKRHLVPFRAAGPGRRLLQAAISGISAVVDHTGRVRSRTRLFDPTGLIGEVATYRGRTPCTVLGDWAVAAAAVLLAGAVAAGRRRRPARDGARS